MADSGPDRERHRTKIAGVDMEAYDPLKVVSIIERVAAGETLRSILKPGTAGLPSRSTFNKWLALYKEAKDAYLIALEISARSFEEEALDEARALKKSPVDGTNVRAHETLLAQLRWSATRRNPREFGDRADARVVVPIMIITPLDLGQEGARKVEGDRTVYEIAAEVGKPGDVPALPAPAQPPMEPVEPIEEAEVVNPEFEAALARAANPAPLPRNSFRPGSEKKPWKRQTKLTQYTGKGSTHQGAPSVRKPASPQTPSSPTAKSSGSTQ